MLSQRQERHAKHRRELECEPPPRVAAYHRRLAAVVAGSMALFVLGASLWVVDGGTGPRNLFHTGAIDALELGALALMAGVAIRASSRAPAAPRLPAPR